MKLLQRAAAVLRAAPLFCVSLLCAFGGNVLAQGAYPNKPIRLITPFVAGGSTTTIARIIGQKLTDAWGQPVVVDNRPGGNTLIGTEAVVKAAPDGYTIMLVSINHALNPILMSAWPYDPIRDFSLVSTLGSSEYMLAVHPSVPANNLQEFIAYAKARPGKLNYAISATGGPGHLAGELFDNTAGTRLVPVPYKGGAQATTDLVGGQVQLSFNVPANFIQFVKAGKLKALGISGKSRLAALPDVPTFVEGGLLNFEPGIWFGVVAPAGTPRPIVDKLSNEIIRILAMADVRETLLNNGINSFSSTPEQFASLIRSDSAKWGQVIKKANIKIEE